MQINDGLFRSIFGSDREVFSMEPYDAVIEVLGNGDVRLCCLFHDDESAESLAAVGADNVILRAVIETAPQRYIVIQLPDEELEAYWDTRDEERRQSGSSDVADDARREYLLRRRVASLESLVRERCSD